MLFRSGPYGGPYGHFYGPNSRVTNSRKEELHHGVIVDSPAGLSSIDPLVWQDISWIRVGGMVRFPLTWIVRILTENRDCPLAQRFPRKVSAEKS